MGWLCFKIAFFTVIDCKIVKNDIKRKAIKAKKGIVTKPSQFIYVPVHSDSKEQNDVIEVFCIK
ncbi:hypothetical protein AN161_08395 [Lysinibacillus sp. FJAT-14222]|nr:hypothetical protein AN161_08395 [Lysinibacillus sp. FJAT-14222]